MNFNKGQDTSIITTEGSESLDDRHVTNPKDSVVAENLAACKLVEDLTKIVSDSNSDVSKERSQLLKPKWADESQSKEFFEPSDYYWEVISVAKKRKSLEKGEWIKYNRPLMRGFELGEELGVLSSKEGFFSRHTKIEYLIDRIGSFEEVLMYRSEELAHGRITKSELLEVIEDFSNYSLALATLKNMLETKLPNGTFKYVEDGTIYHKPRIRKEVSDFLRRKTNHIFNRLEKLKLTSTEENTMLANPLNFIKCKPVLDNAPRLIGIKRLDLSTFDPSASPFVYKRQLVPGSISHTWINSKSLREGSWDNIIPMKSENRSICKILKHLEEAKEMYTEAIPERDQLYNEDPNVLEKSLIKRIENLRNIPLFREKYEKGKEAIIQARKIIEKRAIYDIGRTMPTLGRKYVGKWRIDDKSKQISIQQAEDLESILDILSGFYVFVESEGSVKPSLYHHRLIRSLNNEKFWVCESVEEQNKRESKTKTILNALIAFAFILSGLSAFMPGLLAVVAVIFAVRLLLGVGVTSWALLEKK